MVCKKNVKSIGKKNTTFGDAGIHRNTTLKHILTEMWLTL
jgi:hypothetical protein